MDKIKQKIQALDEADWQTLLDWVVGDEKLRREAAPAVDAGRADLVKEIWQAHPDQRPDYTPDADSATAEDWPDWVQPTGALDCYPAGAGVTHDGARWINTLPGLNPHAPGAVGAGWVRHYTPTPDGAPGTRDNPVAWAVGISATPAGGDGITWVTHDGHLWECLTSHVTHEGWPPSAATHAVWRDHGPLGAGGTTEPTPAPSEGENDGTDTPGDSVPVTEFKPGEQVKEGDLRLYNGTLYEVLQEHTTALHWAPDVEHSLWKQVRS